MAYSSEVLAGTRICRGKFHFVGSALAQELIHCGWRKFLQSASLRVNPTHGWANSIQNSTTMGVPLEETFLEHINQVIR